MSDQNKGSASFGADIRPDQLFTVGIPFEGKIDIDYLIDIPNKSVALQAIEFMQDQNNELELLKRHTPDEVARAWRGVLRGCIAQGLDIPHGLRGFAARLGIVVPG